MMDARTTAELVRAFLETGSVFATVFGPEQSLRLLFESMASIVAIVELDTDARLGEAETAAASAILDSYEASPDKVTEAWRERFNSEPMECGHTPEQHAAMAAEDSERLEEETAPNDPGLASVTSLYDWRERGDYI